MTATDIAFLAERAAVAHDRFMNADAAGSFAVNPQAADFSIMTPFGGATTGGIDWSPEQIAGMSRRFEHAVTSFEVLTSHATRDMVVLVAIERAHGVVAGLAEQNWSLRVTLVFQRKDDGWELAHRHADPLVAPISLDQLATIARGEVTSGRAP
jgi:ketosteroid isomerase-like protein